MWPWAGPALVAAHPGAVVVTVAAGKPPPHPLSGWDGKCGFAEGDDVIGLRRKEDEEALKHLGAQALWLELLDRQYMGGVPPSRVEVAQAIESVVKATAPDLVASPLGLGHPDHLVTVAACRDVARRMPGVTWIFYEDVIYRATASPAEQAIAQLAAEGCIVRPLSVTASESKRAAIERYTSQVKGLGDLSRGACLPARYWEVDSRT